MLCWAPFFLFLLEGEEGTPAVGQILGYVVEYGKGHEYDDEEQSQVHEGHFDPGREVPAYDGFDGVDHQVSAIQYGDGKKVDKPDME